MTQDPIISTNSELDVMESSSKRLQLKAKYLSQNQPNQKVSTTYNYFLKNVDTLFGDLISKLLQLQPNNVPIFMFLYFKTLKSSSVRTPAYELDIESNEKKMDHKAYFNQYVAAIVTSLVKNVAINKPDNIVDYLYLECCKLAEQQPQPSLINGDAASNTINKKNHTPVSSVEMKHKENQNVHVESARITNITESNLDTTVPVTTATTIVTNTITTTDNIISTNSIATSSSSSSSLSRAKLEDAKSLAESINHMSSPPGTGRKLSIARNKLENALDYEVMIQNNPQILSTLNTSLVNNNNSNSSSNSNKTTSTTIIPIMPQMDLSTTTTITSSSSSSSSSARELFHSESQHLFKSQMDVNNKQFKNIQIAVLGLGNAGKSTIINLLQGKTDITKPTVGFRPITLFYDNMTRISFYDLGGGEKIRGIWNQYYHDIHGIIYVIDASSNEQEIEKSINILCDVISHSYCHNKSIIIFLNKKDKINFLLMENLSKTVYEKVFNAMMLTNESDDEIKSDLNHIRIVPCCGMSLNPFIADNGAITTNNDNNNNNMNNTETKLLESSSSSSQQQSSPRLDPVIESNLQWMIDTVKTNYDLLNERVNHDTQIKAKADTMKRLEREKNVLKTKIALAFHHEIHTRVLYETLNNPKKNNNYNNSPRIEPTTTKNSNQQQEAKEQEEEEVIQKGIAAMVILEKDMDVFTKDEGLAFLSSEIGIEIEHLPDIALNIAELLGYQRLALQIIGGFKVPVNKKKLPLTWEEIYDIVVELRMQLGLNRSNSNSASAITQ